MRQAHLASHKAYRWQGSVKWWGPSQTLYPWPSKQYDTIAVFSAYTTLGIWPEPISTSSKAGYRPLCNIKQKFNTKIGIMVKELINLGRRSEAPERQLYKEQYFLIVPKWQYLKKTENYSLTWVLFKPLIPLLVFRIKKPLSIWWLKVH